MLSRDPTNKSVVLIIGATLLLLLGPLWLACRAVCCEGVYVVPLLVVSLYLWCQDIEK